MAIRVLIVDDSPAMRAFIGRVLRLSGIEISKCLQAAGGDQALSLLQEEAVDVILTDINMPGMDGEQLLRQLEADEALRSVPVIVVSTDGTECRMARMRSLGAKGYLTKPFLPETLREEIERVLEATHAS